MQVYLARPHTGRNVPSPFSGLGGVSPGGSPWHTPSRENPLTTRAGPTPRCLALHAPNRDCRAHRDRSTATDRKRHHPKPWRPARSIVAVSVALRRGAERLTPTGWIG